MRLALRHGMCCLDDQDWPKLETWIWHSYWSTIRRTDGRPSRTAYAIGWPIGESGRRLEMHRLILDLPPYHEAKFDVDHINGNGLDNRRENLRITTRAQNLANTAARVGTSSFKGVCLDKRTGRWKGQITVDGKNRSLGQYDTEEEAAAVYNAAALEAWGEYARLNDVPDGLVPVSKPRATSRYRGVSFDSKRRVWLAQIMIAGRQHALGRYEDEIEAALAYNAAAREALGDRARLNDDI